MAEKIDKQIINRTYIYLFPILGLANKLKLEDFLYFKGVFLKDRHRPNDKDKLYLLLRFSGDKGYVKFEEKLRKLSNYIDSYDPDKYHTMFVFDIPVEYKREYDLFMLGKYSEFSENYKQSIILFHNYKGKNGQAVINVLYKKEQAYIDMEKILNSGLPESNWIKISRNQEIGRLVEEIIDEETYFIDLKEINLQNY